MALPFLFLISLIIIRNLQLITEIQFKHLEEEIKNNFNSNPMWSAKVERLKKVKDRLKKYHRRISKFTNILAEVHGNRTHPGRF